MNFKKQLVTAVAASAMLLQVATPLAFADTSITISGNGSDSSNATTVSTTTTTTVEQSNNAIVNNNVSSSADSGSNTAKDNTGGNVSVESGNATVKDNIANTLNSNAATVNCCGTNNDTNVTISGNGSDSKNSVGLETGSENSVVQNNNAEVSNSVYAKADSGDNYAKDNTGGNVKVYSGDATTHVGVSTTANANVAQIGGAGQGGAGSLSATISGNGSDSSNAIDLSSVKSAEIFQGNDAQVDNHVTAKAESGDNSAKDNTGGNVTIWSGNAKSEAGIDNTVNFNSAAIDCGCYDNATAKIAGNGSDSENAISADLGAVKIIAQGGEQFGNNADLNNCVLSNGDSGDNYAKDNTGPVVGDPTYVFSGDSLSQNSVSNSGNVNVVGDPISLPGNFDFQFTFDWAHVFGSFFSF